MSELPSRSDWRDVLLRSEQALSQLERSILELSINGSSEAAIATVIGISRSGVWHRLRRLRDRAAGLVADR